MTAFETEPMDAMAVLLDLARAFNPAFALPQLLTTPPLGPATADPSDRAARAEARYQTLVEQIPAVTFMASFENGQSEIYVSPHIETMLGYTAREWIDDPILWYQRLHPDDKQRWNSEFSRTVTMAEAFKADYRFLAKDGRVVWIHGEAKVVRDADGLPQFVQGIGFDITDLKHAEEVLERSREELEALVRARTGELAMANSSLQAAKEEAERANRAKSDFLSRMSHELRTPLNAILGFAQLLQMGGKANREENLSHIVGAGKHLLKLINEVLDIAAIEAGRMQLTIENFSAAEVVQKAVEMAAPLAAKRQIQIFASKAGHTLRADPQRLEQVLLNLLSNAIKYNREAGRVVISIEDEGQGMVRLAVNDTGPGIPARSLQKLFVSFERLDANKTNVEGTGLGLTVCKQLVELMGGQIGVESTVGRGSTFWLRLPKGRMEQPAEVPAEPEQIDGKEGTFTLLYVEDNTLNLTLLQRILERRWKLNFLSAIDGAQGLAMARQFHPDVILLDLFLPDISGEEVLAELRAAKETAEIPVIVFSADATNGQVERLLAAGAQAYLTKPLIMSDLTETIERVKKAS